MSTSSFEQCYELSFQRFEFRAISSVLISEYSTSTFGASALYQMLIPVGESNKLRIGSGPSLVYRLPFRQSHFTAHSFPPVINVEALSSFDVGALGQIQFEYFLARSVSMVFDYRLYLGGLSLDKSDGYPSRVSTSSFCAGLRLPVQ